MIQIRHVPDALHHKLKQRAAAAGMSLSNYLRRELEQVAESKQAKYPSWDEFLELVAPIELAASGESVVEALHAARAERDDQLDRVLGLTDGGGRR